MRPRIDRRPDGLLADIGRHCLGCGDCAASCDILRDISPLRPGDVAKRILGDEADPAVRGYLLKCALCGLCVNRCPRDLPIPEMVIAGREAMIDAGRTDAEIYRIMWVDHDWNAITLFQDTYGLSFDDLLKDTCDILFMPGCSLMNEGPQLVSSTFAWLVDRLEGEVGLLPDCCGMPLLEMGLTDRWRRYEDLFWERVMEMGAKTIVTACPNCVERISVRCEREGLRTVSILELMAEAGVRAPNANGGRITVHDPCPARHTDMGRWVRQILGDYEITEMTHNRESTICCGCGGAVAMAEPETRDRRADERMREFMETRADLCVTYCMACCDTLTRPEGEGTVRHILELVFDQTVDHLRYQAMVQAMWQGDWGLYNDRRLRDSRRVARLGRHDEEVVR